MNFTTIEIEQRSAVAWVWMNRPALHNAFDETLIAELTDVLRALDDDGATRVVVLAGRGKSFSAGADLNWMKRQSEASMEANLADAQRLGELFRTLAQMHQPTIARVHGAAMAGGMGLAAACDLCVASTAAVFATSEVKLGLVPAVISPYVVRAIGERQCLRYFQTAERIDAKRAHGLGLVHEVVDPDGLDAEVERLVHALLEGGPLAQAASTALIREVAKRPVSTDLIDRTAQSIANARATSEAKEGLAAFFEKRKPAWAKASDV
jgi:methylglutaconyl-CoA hydratase